MAEQWESPIVDYKNKIILAPMVRVGVLPMRMLASEYGADLVYTEELIDKKLLGTTRVQVSEYRDAKNQAVFQRMKQEKPVVLQIGTATAELALKTALHMYKDYDALDINMGCPKHFSVHGGMGSNLLRDKQRIYDILTTLVKNIPNKPITCKIRLLDDPKDSIDLVKMIEQTGVKAFGLHCRYIPQRPREPAHWNLAKPIVEAVQIPVIVNGDVFTREDINKLKLATGCSSVMIARGALWNMSIFKEQPLSVWNVSQDILQKCKQYQHPFLGTKYILMKMLEVFPKSKTYQAVTSSKSFADLDTIFAQPTDAVLNVLYNTSNKQEKRKATDASLDEPKAKKQKVQEQE